MISTARFIFASLSSSIIVLSDALSFFASAHARQTLSQALQNYETNILRSYERRRDVDRVSRGGCVPNVTQPPRRIWGQKHIGKRDTFQPSYHTCAWQGDIGLRARNRMRASVRLRDNSACMSTSNVPLFCRMTSYEFTFRRTKNIPGASGTFA